MAFDVNKLTSPKTFQESASAGPKFQDGVFKTVDSAYLVYKGDDRKPREGEEIKETDKAVAHLVHYLKCWRLDEQHNPITDDEGSTVFEVFNLGLGGTSLLKLRPAKADGPQDADREWAGENEGQDVGTRGPTVKLAHPDAEPKLPNGNRNPQFFDGLDTRSGASVFYASLVQANAKPELTENTWAPAYLGGIFEIRTVFYKDKKTGAFIFGDTPPGVQAVPIMESDRKDRQGKVIPIPYKAVFKIHKHPTGTLEEAPAPSKKKAPAAPAGPEGKAAAPAAAAAAASNGGGGDSVEAMVLSILETLGQDEQLSGKSFGRKAFYKLVSDQLDARGITPTQKTAYLMQVKNDEWVAANAGTFDLTVTAGADGKLATFAFSE